MVKALLDNSTMGMFMDRQIVAKHRFKLQKLERLVTVRSIDRTNNSVRTIIYQVSQIVAYLFVIGL